MSSEQQPDDGQSANSSARGPAGKKPFALRIDESTYKALEKWAADEFRSVNGQVEWLIHQALKSAGRVKHDDKHDTRAGNEEQE
jgi:hypothetical protein